MQLRIFLCLAAYLLLALVGAGVVDGKRTYGISSLSFDNCIVADNLQPLLGDDRSGIAITPERLFHVGDVYTGNFDAVSLNDVSRIPVNDGIFSDLGDGSLWALAINETTPINSDFIWYDDRNPNLTITHLIPLSSTNNGSFDDTRDVIALQVPLSPLYDDDDTRPPTLFAGVRGFVFVAGMQGPSPMAGVFHVSTSTGQVNRIFPEGRDPVPNGWTWSLNGSISWTENWVSWGVMEENQGLITLVAAGESPESQPGVHRWNIDGTFIETVLSGGIADCAAITTNLFEKNAGEMRWYLHGEDGSTAIPGASSEWLASCQASHFSLCGNGDIDAGEQCDDGNLDNGDGCSDACDREEGSSASSLSGFFLSLL